MGLLADQQAKFSEDVQLENIISFALLCSRKNLDVKSCTMTKHSLSEICCRFCDGCDQLALEHLPRIVMYICLVNIMVVTGRRVLATGGHCAPATNGAIQ
jgi:hypothetical protein